MRARLRNAPKVLPVPVRLLVAALCILLGFGFFPMFIVGGAIAFSVYADIREAPRNLVRAAKLEAALRAPVTVEDLRAHCGSPAETAFLHAMVDAYRLTTGPGAIEGCGLRLRNQVPMGHLNIYRTNVTHQYYADFLVDEELVVEIDGAAYHSSPEAVARDLQRDADMRAEGYRVLRIPARTALQAPTETVRLVEDARTRART